MSSSSDMVVPPPPLHVAVWEGDIERVRSILNAVCPEGEEFRDPVKVDALKNLLELKDVRGNSALHLAVRIVQPRQHAIVKLLLDRDANVASRNSDGWSCAHDAALCDDEFMLAQIYLRGEKQVMKSLESAQETFMQALEKLPDFEAEIFIEAHSWVPIVSSVLPSDTIRIWKRGTQLRIDSALKGLDGVKWKKGPMSHVYIGRNGGEREGHAVVMDHDSKAFYDVLEAMHNSSVGNMDLALHMSLTTAMSSSSMDATELEFIKLKDVKAQGKRDEGRIAEDEEKKSRSRQRKCPWPGTTYKMQNFSMEAQFRPVVNPDRKLKQLPMGKDSPFEEVQQFVDHLQSSVPNSKDKKGSKLKHKSSSTSGNNSGQTLRLDKGRKVEMHLDVIAGDTVRWEFFSKSSDFCFTATYFHEDQQQPVCRTDGVKNLAIVGAFEVEHNGSFVLMWQNTQKGFTIDRKGIKISYNVVHTRAAVDESSVQPVLPVSASQDEPESSPESAETKEEASNGLPRLTDDQKCEFFRQPDHIPNPITTTTSFVDYFKLQELVNESKETVKDMQQEPKKKSSFFKMFEDKKQHQQPFSAGNNKTVFGMKNTYRSLTLLPGTRRVQKDFEAKVVMTESFPFQLRDFLPVIKFISTTGDHVKNLEEFFQMTLPPGFPVKFELPMMFTVRVAYTFQKITLNPELDLKMFEIPSDYHEVFTLDEVRS
ncbi:Ankyrin repeat domain-containing protein 13C [Phytophthora citrophthora]|uniref:Ankyrin repeat domain-containing protein 13C n=1 Tax=Phytophthora citrophthora TaxID=4793 RepID=A0AAD9G8F3_9STRA|nr:Ankyrin repeat domain-containing protein 13C [Phytophthora citrophthora]